ncbi:MAG: hypothetical protein LBS53_08900 [Synergistaceae bacterium]|jgi:hypothetical protein|nr:hypothetical protein [Synergistaceae bacterium]
MASVDEKNYEWFKKNLPELMKNHHGKYLIIHEERDKGAYETFESALNDALKIAVPGEFLIQRCVGEEESTQVICSLTKLPNFS